MAGFASRRTMHAVLDGPAVPNSSWGASTCAILARQARDLSRMKAPRPRRSSRLPLVHSTAPTPTNRTPGAYRILMAYDRDMIDQPAGDPVGPSRAFRN